MTHFLEIPVDWRMPVIVSAFTAAQKVAATYAKAVLNIEDDRTVLARKSMTRWMHGLSAVEPGRSYKHDSERESGISSVASSDANRYSPTSNFLLDRRVPVPLDSDFQHQQFQRELNHMNAEVDDAHTATSSTKIDMLSSVVVEQMLSMPIIEANTPEVSATTAFDNSTSTFCKLLNDNVVTAGAANQIILSFPASLCSEISCDFHVDLDDKKVYRTTLCYRIVYAENTCD